MFLGGFETNCKTLLYLSPEILNEMTKNYICIYLFKEAKLISVKYKKILISTEKLKFTKLFQFIRPKLYTCRYIYMTSFHRYVFRLLTAIIKKQHQHTKLNEM